MRAVAFEPRVRRVICDDVLFDFLGVCLQRLPQVDRAALGGLLRTAAHSPRVSADVLLLAGAEDH